MSTISFKNRIALYFSISTALLIFAVFVVIYFIVRSGVYRELDHDLDTEIKVLFDEITVNDDGFRIADEEWEEKEHNTLDINPIFIQFTNIKGETFAKSPNLKDAALYFRQPVQQDSSRYNSSLNRAAVRQYQVPVLYNKKTVGYIIVATPMEEALQLLKNLQNVLIIAYPSLLAVLFSVARLLAGKSIKPVQAITYASARITRENLGERIPLPDNKDELYVLSETINALLLRIENAVVREKQFTSDASHELRTPLAVIKGTLEVLMRKPRSREEYEEKIKFCIEEVNRINTIVDRLLMLARFESSQQVIKKEQVDINAVLGTLVERHTKNSGSTIKVEYEDNNAIIAQTDEYLLTVILDNIIENALKYSRDSKPVKISAKTTDAQIFISVTDNGMGIAEDEVENVFNPFFRSKAATGNKIKGTGIGLSIVKRLCELLGIEIALQSKAGAGTAVNITIPQ